MNGSISIDSAPGSGTRFRITLPLLEVRETAIACSDGEPEPAAAAATSAALEGKRLLLADDSETKLAEIRGMLRHTGARCTEARDGLDAVARWTEQADRQGGPPFDLLALDINMPGRTGHEALADIRMHETRLGFDPAPAIAVPVDVLPEQVVEVMAAGFDAVLAKPVGRADIVGMTARFVSRASPAIISGSKLKFARNRLTTACSSPTKAGSRARS